MIWAVFILTMMIFYYRKEEVWIDESLNALECLFSISEASCFCNACTPFTIHSMFLKILLCPSSTVQYILSTFKKQIDLVVWQFLEENFFIYLRDVIISSVQKNIHTVYKQSFIQTKQKSYFLPSKFIYTQNCEKNTSTF